MHFLIYRTVKREKERRLPPTRGNPENKPHETRRKDENKPHETRRKEEKNGVLLASLSPSLFGQDGPRDPSLLLVVTERGEEKRGEEGSTLGLFMPGRGEDWIGEALLASL